MYKWLTQTFILFVFCEWGPSPVGLICVVCLIWFVNLCNPFNEISLLWLLSADLIPRSHSALSDKSAPVLPVPVCHPSPDFTPCRSETKRCNWYSDSRSGELGWLDRKSTWHGTQGWERLGGSDIWCAVSHHHPQTFCSALRSSARWLRCWSGESLAARAALK